MSGTVLLGRSRKAAPEANHLIEDCRRMATFLEGELERAC
jgi:hypothetical protein